MKNNPITMTMDLISEISGTKRVTYDTMSKKLGVARQTVINYEKKPDIIPCSVLKKLSRMSGVTIDELTADDAENTIPLSISGIFDKLYSPSSDIIKAIEVIQDFFIDSNRAFEYDKEIDKMIEAIKNMIKDESKLKIAICGVASTGKSSLINYILGENIIPVNRFYGTPAFTYYHHISEKPDCIYGKNDTIIICEPTADASAAGKKETKIFGHHSTLLKAYVKNDDGCTIEDGYTIKQIDVYLDNENLKGCIITDTPRWDIGIVSVYEEILLKLLDQNYVLFTTDPRHMLRFQYEVDLIWRLIKRESNGSFMRSNIVITHMDLYDNSEAFDKSVVESCKKNLLSAVSDDERKYIEEKYENRFLTVDIYRNESNIAFNDVFSTTVNELATEKFNFIMNTTEKACSIISKDYSARKNILSSKTSFNIFDESEFQNKAENLFLKQEEEKSECNMHQNNALKNCLKKFDEITSAQNIFYAIKGKKINFSTYVDYLNLWDKHLVKEWYRILEEEIDSEFDKFDKWFDLELDKLLNYHTDDIYDEDITNEDANDFFTIYAGFLVRNSLLNGSIENPYDAEQLKKIDNDSSDFINDEDFYKKIIEIIDMDNITNKERNRYFAEAISSRYKNDIFQNMLIRDIKGLWKAKIDKYFEYMRGIIKVLQENYILPTKRGTPEEATQRAKEYEDASNIIKKIGQRCGDKIENAK